MRDRNFHSIHLIGNRESASREAKVATFAGAGIACLTLRTEMTRSSKPMSQRTQYCNNTNNNYEKKHRYSELECLQCRPQLILNMTYPIQQINYLIQLV